MKKSKPVRFKYRIVINDDTDYTYAIERKGWFFWKSIGKCKTQEDAENEIRKLARLEIKRPGSVVLEFTEQDFLAEKLRG